MICGWSRVGVKGTQRSLSGCLQTRLSQVVLSAAGMGALCLKNSAVLGLGVLQATKVFYTGQPRLASVPPLPEYGGKVHLGLILEFFQFLYPKTGVTEPYVCGTGLSLYFPSKEMYAITPETFSTITVVGLIGYVVKKYGASIGEFLDKLNEQKNCSTAPGRIHLLAQSIVSAPILCHYIKFLLLSEKKKNCSTGRSQASMKQIQDANDMEKAQQALVQKRCYLFDVQRNNITLALEVNYREWLYRTYKEVKKRLGYHISVEDMLHCKEEEHMTNWVEKNVVESISAQQEKETIAKCIADLKLLAKKVQAQSVT
ncbi:ATP synthase F(0) complex subunit B1, mitochondrial-like [Peromyscus leucopus]|uniref:ATP synthase F(0) complex subunit B1, mitochondrial-like n=1 Tax=Peromyscus leucopus TaxID=10041 RepID=UPI001884FE90|nr:ATP synthase F(0) complex subunit B1, mitochondrial-like [Peromyscus leucopus]